MSVQLPPAHLLEWWQDELITAALSTTPIGLLLPALRALSTAHNVTIGIGPAVSGGIVAGAGLSIGMVIAPGGHLGFYGTVSGLLGAIVSISATATVTVVFGGPSVFNGSALAAGVSIDTGVGPMIAAHVLMSTSGGGVIGVSGSIGVSVGPSPFEAFPRYQSRSRRWAWQLERRHPRPSASAFGIGLRPSLRRPPRSRIEVSRSGPTTLRDRARHPLHDGRLHSRCDPQCDWLSREPRCHLRGDRRISWKRWEAIGTRAASTRRWPTTAWPWQSA